MYNQRQFHRDLLNLQEKSLKSHLWEKVRCQSQFQESKLQKLGSYLQGEQDLLHLGLALRRGSTQREQFQFQK